MDNSQLYNYIVYEVKDIDGNINHVVSYTKTSPIEYIRKMCKRYIETGEFTSENSQPICNWKFIRALKSWKGKKQKQLEEHLTYFVTTKYQNSFENTWRYARELFETAEQGKFENIEKFSYVHPTNKWTTEETVYKLTKKLFKKYHVIYQYRPEYLKSSIGGQMSYDIFIKELNVAIEYQGKQHFEPVNFFGGEYGFHNTQRRDYEKLKLSREHNVHLIYINYWEEINEQLILNKINEAINNL